MFFLERDEPRLIRRLEKEFRKILALQNRDIKEFKDAELRNFGQTTNMLMQINQDIDLVK